MKVHPIPHASFEITRSRFIQTLHHSSVSWEINLLCFFSWKCTWFGQKKLIKVQNFRLSTAHVKFHQLCTLIDSFCWKYIKFKLKKYIALMSHDSEDWCRIWRKTDLLFQKWQEFGELWPKHSKVSTICTFIGSYCAIVPLVFTVWPNGVNFHDNEEWYKFGEESTCHFKIDIRNLTNFHLSTRKSKKFPLYWVPFEQSIYCLS